MLIEIIFLKCYIQSGSIIGIHWQLPCVVSLGVSTDKENYSLTPQWFRTTTNKTIGKYIPVKCVNFIRNKGPQKPSTPPNDSDVTSIINGFFRIESNSYFEIKLIILKQASRRPQFFQGGGRISQLGFWVDCNTPISEVLRTLLIRKWWFLLWCKIVIAPILNRCVIWTEMK